GVALVLVWAGAPRPGRGVGVGRLVLRPVLALQLDVGDGGVVGARVAADDLVRASGRNVAALPTNHHAELPLIVDGVRLPRHVNRVARPYDRVRELGKDRRHDRRVDL